MKMISMRLIRMRFAQIGDKPIILGRAREQDATRIEIDCTAELAVWPDGVPQITHVLSGGAYPAITTLENGILRWDVRAVDVPRAGHGRLEVAIARPDGGVYRSAVAQTVTFEAACGCADEEIPSGVDSWLDEAYKLLAKLEATGGGSGSGGSTAPGTPGKDGFSPIIEIETIAGGHRVTVTDAEGEKTFDVMNGKDGADGKDGLNGKAGAAGPAGQAATIEIAQTQMLASGSAATVTEAADSTPQARKYILGVPRGADGEPGKDYNLTPEDKQEIAGMVHVEGGGAVIDDTAPSASKTYSSSKIEEKLADAGNPTDEQIQEAVNAYLTENPVSGSAGLTESQVNALDALVRIAVFSEDASDEYETFRIAFGIPIKYAVTYNLESVFADSAPALANEGSTFIVNLTAFGGFELDAVTVTMGGADITSSAYADGVVTITNVTGEITITATAALLPEVSVDPIFSLAEETYFDGTKTFDTGFAPCSESYGNGEWTIAFDVSGNDATVANETLFMSIGPYVNDNDLATKSGHQLHMNAHTNYKVPRFCINGTTHTDNMGWAWRTKPDFEHFNIVVTHEAGAGDRVENGIALGVMAYGLTPEGEYATSEFGRGAYGQSLTKLNENTILIGGYRDAEGTVVQALNNVTIHRCAIWNRVLSEPEIKQWLGVSE